MHRVDWSIFIRIKQYLGWVTLMQRFLDEKTSNMKTICFKTMMFAQLLVFSFCEIRFEEEECITKMQPNVVNLLRSFGWL